jgi:hypothetical protein
MFTLGRMRRNEDGAVRSVGVLIAAAFVAGGRASLPAAEAC